MRHILYLFEDYFEAKKDIESLNTILYYYCFFDDAQHQRRFLLNQGEDDTTFLSEFLNKFLGRYTLSDLKEYELRAKVELKDFLVEELIGIMIEVKEQQSLSEENFLKLQEIKAL